MPSWSERPHVVPTINVNLKPCICTPRAARFLRHSSACEAAEVLLPCPIPRSVTFQVVLAPCRCFHRGPRDAGPPPNWAHLATCPARPVKVSCSIERGHHMVEWAESTVSDCEPIGGRIWEDNTEEARALGACRARWASVKALATGGTCPDPIDAVAGRPAILDLFAQRDAVFAALFEMARAEDGQVDARDRIRKVMGLPPSERLAPELRESAIELRAYVARLIESVSVLS